MADFDAKAVASQIENLAQSALQEPVGFKEAELNLVNIVHDLQNDPAHLKAVADQVAGDTHWFTTLPFITLTEGLGSAATGISISQDLFTRTGQTSGVEDIVVTGNGWTALKSRGNKVTGVLSGPLKPPGEGHE